MLLLFRVSAVSMHTQLAKHLLPQGPSVYCLRLSAVELLIPFVLCYRSLFQPSCTPCPCSRSLLTCTAIRLTISISRFRPGYKRLSVHIGLPDPSRASGKQGAMPYQISSQILKACRFIICDYYTTPSGVDLSGYR